jgi:hypothetical protein
MLKQVDKSDGLPKGNLPRDTKFLPACTGLSLPPGFQGHKAQQYYFTLHVLIPLLLTAKASNKDVLREKE